jgi:hypothetical protein
MSLTTFSATTPLVFQCACKSILSDSTEFVCTVKTGDGAECVVVRGEAAAAAAANRLPPAGLAAETQASQKLAAA